MKKKTAIAWAGSGAELARRISKRWPDDPITRAGVSAWPEKLGTLRSYQVRTLMKERRARLHRQKAERLEAQVRL